jgi:hypothetical protein
MARSFIAKAEMSGVKAAFRGLDATRKLHLSRLIAGVADMAKQIYERSQVYVPVDTGDLKASGSWQPDEETGGTFTKDFGVTYSVKYEAPYAVFVHERMDTYHAPPTGAKYLERATLEIVASMNGHVRFGAEFGIQGRTLSATESSGDVSPLPFGSGD